MTNLKLSLFVACAAVSALAIGCESANIKRARERCLAKSPSAVFTVDESGCKICNLNQALNDVEPEALSLECDLSGPPETYKSIGCGYLLEENYGDVGDSWTTIYELVDGTLGAGGAGLMGRQIRRTSTDSGSDSGTPSCSETILNSDVVIECEEWTSTCSE